jgi:hypothetical protein
MPSMIDDSKSLTMTMSELGENPSEANMARTQQLNLFQYKSETTQRKLKQKSINLNTATKGKPFGYKNSISVVSKTAKPKVVVPKLRAFDSNKKGSFTQEAESVPNTGRDKRDERGVYIDSLPSTERKKQGAVKHPRTASNAASAFTDRQSVRLNKINFFDNKHISIYEKQRQQTRQKSPKPAQIAQKTFRKKASIKYEPVARLQSGKKPTMRAAVNLTKIPDAV